MEHAVAGNLTACARLARSLSIQLLLFLGATVEELHGWLEEADVQLSRVQNRIHIADDVLEQFPSAQ